MKTFKTVLANLAIVASVGMAVSSRRGAKSDSKQTPAEAFVEESLMVVNKMGEDFILVANIIIYTLFFATLIIAFITYFPWVYETIGLALSFIKSLISSIIH